MKISIHDKSGAGILAEFAQRIGAVVNGRFVRIPEEKGGGYLTGFSWGSDMRMMIRNYHLNEEVSIEWTNLAIAKQEPVVFRINGIFPSKTTAENPLLPEQASILIGRQMVTSLIAMPSKKAFRSVTIAVSHSYLQKLFGHMEHPIIQSILNDKGNFAYETTVTTEMIAVAANMETPPVQQILEEHYIRLKCEELLCYIFSLLAEREAMPTSNVHIKDVQAVYAIKTHLQANLDKAPDIAGLAASAGMSEPKLRRLFRQVFGKNVFEFYQFMRMQEAARLLKESRLSVSEVGYQLGFSNLSHFSKVFEAHHQQKPKKYASS